VPVARETRTYGDLSFEKHLRLLPDAIHTKHEDSIRGHPTDGRSVFITMARVVL